MITASDLIGTWRFSRPGEGSGEAFLHFTYTKAYDFIYEGEIRQPLQLFYSLEPPDTIRFRNRPDEEGWTCRLEFDGSTLVIHAADSKTVCTRPPATEIPAWFQDELSAYMARA